MGLCEAPILRGGPSPRPAGLEPTCVHPEKVALAQSAAPAEADLQALTAMFKLLGDPTRARLL